MTQILSSPTIIDQGAVDAVLMYERRSESAVGYLLGRQASDGEDLLSDPYISRSMHTICTQELHALGRGLVRGDGLGGAAGRGGTAAGGAGRGAPSAAPRRR